MDRSPGDEFLLARDNPVRLRILVLAARGDLPGQISASALKEKLADEFGDLEIRKIHFHLTRLQGVGLLPRPLLPGA